MNHIFPHYEQKFLFVQNSYSTEHLELCFITIISDAIGVNPCFISMNQVGFAGPLQLPVMCLRHAAECGDIFVLHQNKFCVLLLCKFKISLLYNNKISLFYDNISYLFSHHSYCHP
jgi:hypothetical protein